MFLLPIEPHAGIAVAGQSARQIRQEFSRVLRVWSAPGDVARHPLAFRDLLYLRLKSSLDEAGVALKPVDRRALYAVLKPRCRHAGPWQRSGQRLQRTGAVPITLDLSAITAQIHAQLRLYHQGARQIERRQDLCSGQPVFKNTRIPVAQVVAQLQRGVPPSEITEDYPGIGASGLQYAALRARLDPLPRRPVKPLPLRRVARAAPD